MDSLRLIRNDGLRLNGGIAGFQGFEREWAWFGSLDLNENQVQEGQTKNYWKEVLTFGCRGCVFTVFHSPCVKGDFEAVP